MVVVVEDCPSLDSVLQNVNLMSSTVVLDVCRDLNLYCKRKSGLCAPGSLFFDFLSGDFL